MSRRFFSATEAATRVAESRRPLENRLLLDPSHTLSHELRCDTRRGVPLLSTHGALAGVHDCSTTVPPHDFDDDTRDESETSTFFFERERDLPPAARARESAAQLLPRRGVDGRGDASEASDGGGAECSE